jgi:hypothetical protein
VALTSAAVVAGALWTTGSTAAHAARRALAVVGRPQAGQTLVAQVRLGGQRLTGYRYTWLVCDWTGATCSPAAAGKTFRLTSAVVGHRLRVTARPLKRGLALLAAGPTPIVIGSAAPVVAAAGDIACDPTSSNFNGGAGGSHGCAEMATSDLLLKLQPAAVLALGDNQYECGDASAFAASFGPSWGRLRAIIHPAVGNHEYGKPCHRNDATPYFQYFGTAAGPPEQGWYSYDVGTWHLIALNSECSYGSGATAVGGCAPGSPEETWLRQDLAAHQNACTLAYWHEPRFSSGEHGDAVQMATIWNDLVAAHVDVVLSGHNHDYERFAPIGTTPVSPDTHSTAGSSAIYQQPQLDPNGITEFVVGTGGRSLYHFSAAPLTGEAVRFDTSFGVLALTLQPGGYSWQFQSVPDGTVLDSGSASCH